MNIALIGNPNSGKSTLFNALTGSHQRVGNWPGVTVEKKMGCFMQGAQKIKVVDLPGTYNLMPDTDDASIDVKIVTDYILSHQSDLLVNIIDASNLERSLFLTTQLAELGAPMVVVLNMMDNVKRKGLSIDIEKLSQQLNCPVVPVIAKKSQGLSQLKSVLLTTSCAQHAKPLVQYPAVIQTAVDELVTMGCQQITPLAAVQMLEGQQQFPAAFEHKQKTFQATQAKLTEKYQDDLDIAVADSRYQFINTILASCIDKASSKRFCVTRFLDHIVLNRFLGIPIFLGVMYVMFLFAINVGGAFQDFFDIGSNTLFVQGLSQLLAFLHFPNWLNALLSAGVGKGINTTITFIPVIGGMFLFLSFLEASGYMTRAAFVVDRLMRAIGLPGKSFVPMIVGFGCNVPAIMATRTLESKRDRILTIMMSPFMSCGARLAIFAVFTAAFFPVGGQNVVFALYLIGVLMAVVTGLILRKTVLKGESSPLVMEMPEYRLPTFKTLMRQTWHRLKRFLMKAGKVIVPVCILIGTLNAFTVDGHVRMGDGSHQHSVLSAIGRTVTPIFAPMGIKQDNWPATVGLVTGMLAKEVVVASLNTLYTQEGHLKTGHTNHFNLWAGLSAAVMSVPHNLAGLGSSLGNPVLASAPSHDVNQGVYGVMYTLFGGQIAAFAYLLFVLLYFPCASATAVMAKELNKRWTIFSVCWTTGLAYGVAVVFYQAATFASHPYASSAWVLGFIGLFFGTIVLMKYIASRQVRLSDQRPRQNLFKPEGSV